MSSARAKAEYPAFINGYAEGFVSSYENSVKDGEAEDLSAYLAISDIEDIWREFKAVNALDKLSAAQLEGFDGRVEKLKTSASNSFYSGLWREGESWQAKLTENGLYVTGEGAYGETLGYNKKLELGKTTEIKFNVIYALRKLGANHLHIGFYPVPGTGTMGTSDGVRVDFWFSGTVIEVKPVNGRTELPVYDAAYISVADTGFFDPELPDPDQGAYTVKLGANGSTLFISVNGLEMDLTGLDANLYKNGCYLTVSAMSVKGADRNELVITSVGDISFVPANGGSDGTDDQSSNKKKGCKGALGGETFIALACFVALKRRKNYFEKGE
ncbi:MAG: hypothetical protein IJR61_04575 [Clostridia bacterium]|nr:hypothetical protein [Clostridia bacterium]